MSSLFNVYKKISKKYGINYNTRFNSPFQYIPIINKRNKTLFQIKNENSNFQRNKEKYLIKENNNNILNFSEQMNPKRYITHLSKSNTCSKFLSQISNEETKNSNNLKHEANKTRYNNYFIMSHLLKNKYISDIMTDKKDKQKMEKTDDKIDDMMKDLNIYQSLKSDLSNLSTYSNQKKILNKKNQFTNTLMRNIDNKFGIRLFHKNMSENILLHPKKKITKDIYLYKKIFYYSDKKKIKSENKLDNKLNIIYSEDETQYQQKLKKLNSLYKKLGKKKIYNMKLSQSENKVKSLQRKVDFMKKVVDYAYPDMVLTKIKEHDKALFDKTVSPPNIITSKINLKRYNKNNNDISKDLEKSLNIQKCVFKGFNNIIINK